MQIFVNTNYDFVKWRFHAVAFSLIWVLIGFGLFFKNGINWGIDFAGGANIVLKFRGAVPLARLRADLKDATIQQYGSADRHSVLIRLPEQHKESDYAGQIVAKLVRDLNPEAASNKLDLNYQGRARLADLLFSTDPNVKGTNDDAKKYYADLAQAIINKRSELGLFTSMNEISSVPGVTSTVERELSEN